MCCCALMFLCTALVDGLAAAGSAFDVVCVHSGTFPFQHCDARYVPSPHGHALHCVTELHSGTQAKCNGVHKFSKWPPLSHGTKTHQTPPSQEPARHHSEKRETASLIRLALDQAFSPNFSKPYSLEAHLFRVRSHFLRRPSWKLSVKKYSSSCHDT